MNDEKNIELAKNGSGSLKIANAFFDIFESLLKAIIIVFFILTFLFKICTVSGASMNNTLYNGERLIVSSIAYTPKENDIIVFHQTGYILNEPIVKRVIATGEKYVKLNFDEQKIYVSNDEHFEESDLINEEYVYLSYDKYEDSGTRTFKVPEGYLFVMGDNRNNSTDSRSNIIGFVDQRRVLGKVVLRFAPFDRFGIID